MFKCFALTLLLFGLVVWRPSSESAAARTLDLNHKKIPAVAFENSPLKLVGTAVTRDPGQSIAVIEDLNNRQQWSFRQGDQAGDFLFKAIHRGYIVVNADGTERKVRVNSYLDQVATAIPSIEPAGQPSATSYTSNKHAGYREIHRVIDRKTVAAALSNPEAVFDSVNITSARLFNRNVGFRITDVDASSIFSKLGLRTGDLLLAINSRRIGGPEDANAVWDTILQGGDINLTVRRRARTYHVNLLIE